MAKARSTDHSAKHQMARQAFEMVEATLCDDPNEHNVERRFRDGHPGAELFDKPVGGNPPLSTLNPFALLLGR